MNSLRPTSYYTACLLALALQIAVPNVARAQWPGTNPPAASPPAGPSPFDRAPAAPAPSAFDRPPAGPSPFDQPSAAQQQPSPCIAGFLKARDDVAKKAKAIETASARKASAHEACGLFNAVVASEAKLIKYATANATACGIPPNALEEMKKGAAQAAEVRARVCQAAKIQQQGPPPPSLSDALGGSQVPSAGNVKPGRGTFDTLTGTPLGAAK